MSANPGNSIMAKNSVKDIQLSFDFVIPGQNVQFITFKGKCKCGYNYELKKADVVLEMTLPCPKCGAIITIK
jgi:hypothetical protein